MIGRLGQLSEPRLRQQAGIEKISDTCRKGYSCPMGVKKSSLIMAKRYLVSVALMSPLQDGTCETTKCVCTELHKMYVNVGILGFHRPLSKVCLKFLIPNTV